MSVRKKWRLRLIPSFRYQTVSSQVDAYRRVEAFRTEYALGMSHTHHVNVEVDEGGGWRLHEQIIFPPRDGEQA